MATQINSNWHIVAIGLLHSEGKISINVDFSLWGNHAATSTLEVIFTPECKFSNVNNLLKWLSYLTATPLYWSFGTFSWILWIWIIHWTWKDSEIWFSKFWAKREWPQPALLRPKFSRFALGAGSNFIFGQNAALRHGIDWLKQLFLILQSSAPKPEVPFPPKVQFCDFTLLSKNLGKSKN